MARTVNQIFSQIVSAYVSAMAAINVTINPATWSRRNKQQLAMNTFAAATATFEQIYDAYTADIENDIAAAAPQTPQWFQAQMLKFQFNLLSPQVLQFDTVNFAPYYTTVIPADQVIKYCSVVAGPLGQTLIKVAAQVSGLPAQIDDGMGGGAYSGSLAAAQSYANLLSDPAITVNVLSDPADVFYCFATIYYQGGYSAIIKTTVVNAVIAYLNGIPFNGYLTLSALEQAILEVAGVNDVVFTNVQAGISTTAYGSGTVLVSGTDGLLPNGNVLQRNYSTVAGYIATPTTGLQQLSETLTFVAQ